MNIKPMPPYFLIRIPKKEQTAKRDKIGSIFVPPTHVFMTRECQAGQIVAIGEDAAKEFPEAKIGNILLHHHFVSGKQHEGTDEGRYLIDQDEMFNYYTVTAKSYFGRQNETYGIFNGGEMIPHKEFVFLEPEPEERNDQNPDEFISEATHITENGLIVFKEWKESRKSMKERMSKLKAQVHELSKTTELWNSNLREDAARGIRILEEEMNTISKQLNKKEYEPHVVFSAPKNVPVVSGDIVYTLNMASRTEMEYLSKKFIVMKSKYISLVSKAA